MTAISQTGVFSLFASVRRMWRMLPAIVGATFMLILATAVHADQSISPEAAAVLDKYVEVTGGRQAYENITNRVIKEKIVHVGMGFEDSVTLYQARPNKQYAIIESEAMGNTQHGTDGNVVWYLSEQAGVIVEEGEARLAGLDTASFDRIEGWRKYYTGAELLGKESVDGHLCHKISLTPRHGEPETRSYDVDSHLLVKAIVTRLSSKFPPVTFELTFDDYKPVDGLLLPHKVHRSFDMCGSKREMLFVTESIKHNEMLASDRFDPPANVKGVAFLTGTAELLHTIATGEAPAHDKVKPSPCGKPQQASTGKKEAATGTKRSPCGGGS